MFGSREHPLSDQNLTAAGALCVFAVTESPRGADHLIEDRLDSFGASDRPKQSAQCALLRAQVLDLAREFKSIVAWGPHPLTPTSA